ncbi:MAG TPA: NADH-quinone oxidoreductase subunit A [Acidimicrobiales bacterium]
MEQYFPILTMLVLAFLFAAGSFLASRLLGPSRPTQAKMAPYECGIVPREGPAQRFPVRFYLIAMIFIIFDIEIIFLYPWAVVYHQLDTFGLSEMVVFSVAVLFSLAYLISNGALDWGPTKRMVAAPVSTLRTSSSTIRRVARPSMVQSEPESEESAPAPDEPLVPAASAEAPAPVAQAG